MSVSSTVNRRAARRMGKCTFRSPSNTSELVFETERPHTNEERENDQTENKECELSKKKAFGIDTFVSVRSDRRVALVTES